MLQLPQWLKLPENFRRTRLNRNQILYLALVALLVLVFLISAIYVISYWVESAQQSGQYNDLASIVESIRQEQATNPNATLPTGTPDPTAPTDGDADQSAILPEYRELYAINNDLVGWISIPGTRVDYPVCQTRRERDYYLYRNFYGEDSKSGCIYVREACDVFRPSDNVVIYGHRMNSGEMFADLMNYRDKKFWESHQTFTFDTIYQRHTYQVIAVFVTSGDPGVGYAYHQFNDAHSEADFDKFMQTVHSLQFYDTGHTAKYGDMLITLSTCTPRYESPSNGRLVVVAKRIS